ncbi:hypothetical protein YC2023_108127 [Brassica napus]
MANHPHRRDPNTSPDHSISRSDGRNSAGGTNRPVKARSISPTEETSRPVLTEGGPGDPSQAGITAAAGTRLALQWILVKGFRLYSLQLPDSKSPDVRHQGLNIVKGNQEDALWRQTTNGSFLVCDWLVLVLDRLSLAVKRREPRP